jgi:protein phosphatase
MTDRPPPATSALSVSAAGLSDPGRERPENEDAFGEFPRSRLYVVADGMGGRKAGGVAADLSVREVERFFREQQAAPRTPWPYPMDRALSFGTNLLAVGFKVANRAIREAAATNPEYHRMGATAAALAVGETQVVVAHVGDVRVYRWRHVDVDVDGGVGLSRLTRDHSVIEEMRAARPDMPESTFATIPHRHVVTRALGTREEVEPEVTTHALARGDVYLLCSDGLWNAVAEEEMYRSISRVAPSGELAALARQLVDGANRAGGKDNITALVVRVS